MRAINWVTPVPQDIKNNPPKVLNDIRKFFPQIVTQKFEKYLRNAISK